MRRSDSTQLLRRCQIAIKKETRKTKKLEIALDAFDRIQEEIQKFSIENSRESQRTNLARHKNFIKMVSQIINEVVKNY